MRLLDGGSPAGDRVALYLQNVPQYVIAMLGTWKAGGICVAINPMNKARELDQMLSDSGAAVLVAWRTSTATSTAAEVVRTDGGTRVITTSELEYQTRNDARIFGGVDAESRRAAPRTSASWSTAFRGQSPARRCPSQRGRTPHS